MKKVLTVSDDEDVEINIGCNKPTTIDIDIQTKSEITVNGRRVRVDEPHDFFDEIFGTRFPWWVELIILILAIFCGIVLSK